MSETLFKFIKKAVSKISEVPEEDIGIDSHFQKDLEIDSLEAVEIIYRIEKKYKVKLKIPELEKIQTVGEIYDYCKKKITG